MADITKTLEIIFNGIDKGVSSTVDSLTGKFNSFGTTFKTLDDIAEPFGKMADNVLAADKALAAFAIGGIVASFEASKNFESAVVDLDKVLVNSEGLEQAKAFAKDVAQTYGESTTVVLASIATFKQAGFTVNEAMSLARAGLDLMIAGDISAGEASERLVAILKGFNAPASEAGRVIDILNEVSNNYAANVKELAEGMAMVSPIAKLMGFTFEETAGLLTPVIEVFRSGTMSAEGLKTGLLKLTDDAKPVRDALASIGVSQFNTNGELKSGKEILGEVAQKYSGLSDSQKLFLTQQLVGMDQAPKMAIVFDQYSKVLAVTKDALNSAGSAQGEVDKRLQTSEIAVKQLWTAFVNLGITVGEKFRDQSKEGVKGINEFIQSIDKAFADGSFDPLLELLKKLGTDIGTFFSDLAKTIPDSMKEVNFSPLTEALGSLGEAVKSFFDDFDPKDPEKVKDAIQKAVDVLTLLVNTTKGMADTFAPIIRQIIQSIEDLSKAGTDDQELFGNILAAGKLVMDMGSQLVLALAAMHEWGVNAKDIFEVLGGSVKIVFNSIQVMFDQFVIVFLEGLIKLNKAAELVTFGKFGEEVKAATASLESWRDAVGQDYEAQLKDIDDGLRMVGEGFGVTEESAKTAGESMADFRKKVDALSDIKVEVNPEYYSGALDLIAKFKSEANVTIETTANEDAARKAAGIIKEIVGYTDEGLPVYLYTDVSQPSMEKAKKDLRDGIPTEKQIEIKLQGEIDKEMAEIKAKGEAAQTAFEWNAKLRIEEAKADADRLIESTKVLGSEITSIGDDIVKMFSVKWDDMPIGVYMEYMDSLRQQKELQKQAMEQQQKLMDQQTEYMRLKNDAFKRGEVGIKIDSSGLEPSLEMIMWQILQKVQARANEDSAAFLLGI